jgi:2-methylcitrate dehydratase PrpD
MDQGSTAALVEYLSHLAVSDLPDPCLSTTRALLLDYLGVTLVGSRDESARAASAGADRVTAGGACTVIGRATSSATAAALANGTAAHALELDDGHLSGPIHPGVVVFSAALAASEIAPARVDGARFAVAIVAGYETMIRVAAAMGGAAYQRGFHPTGICGVFGAAVASSVILGLDRRQMSSAIGIAASMAAGCLQCLWDGSWTKRLHAGLAASNGLLASTLAEAGFKGPESAIEGRSGFLKAYVDAPRAEALTEHLGEGFGILATHVKVHACCRGTHSQIDGVLELRRRRTLVPDDIAAIEVTALDLAFPLVCEPAARKYHPESLVDAQFSLPFAVAIAAVFGRASVKEYSARVLHDARVRDIAARVRILRDPDLDARYPAEFPARVRILFNDGGADEITIDHPKGSPDHPLSWFELSDKYHQCADDVIGRAAADEIEERVQMLERLADVTSIWRRCRIGSEHEHAVAEQVSGRC